MVISPNELRTNTSGLVGVTSHTALCHTHVHKDAHKRMETCCLITAHPDPDSLTPHSSSVTSETAEDLDRD